ncbi:hypothetical protein GCM10023191_000190 [Actinoallomurus oryzae]|uniref:Dehydratase n=1 Tax=Actinoallomurus oryzae TaxID=502180 RepID=A0ABP8P6L0_9ACTN
MPAESLAPVRRWGRTTAAATASLAALGVLSTTGTAHADVVLKLNYPLTGTTTIKSTNSSMSLGPGTLATAVDDTGGLTATVDLPPATGSFKEFGVIPVSVTTEFVEASPTTGTVDINTGAVQTTSHLTIKITELKVAGIPTPVGGSCRTETPAEVSVASDADFSVINGGNLNGTYTIPKFKDCLLATPLINLVVPGSGNTITLTLGPASVAASSPTADPSKVFKAGALR